MILSWHLRAFNELSVGDLYDALALRSLVFVVEQKCVFLEPDGNDQKALHLLGRDDSGRLVACARLFGPGDMYDEPAISRVVSHPDVRRTGAGRALMVEAIAQTKKAFGDLPIRIGAQRYLEMFYGSLGFEVAGEPYIEDDIPHIHMLRR